MVFNDYQFCQNFTSKFSDNKKMISSSKFFEKVISDFKDRGYIFNHIAEMQIITIANKVDTSYDFYIKHNMHAVEWRLNAIINKNCNFITKLNHTKRHLIITEFSHVPISNM